MMRAHEEEEEEEDYYLSPPWLIPMLRANYFIPCSIHANSNKSECNMFCLDCTSNAFCSYCLINHKNHRVLQVFLHQNLILSFFFPRNSHKVIRNWNLSAYVDTKVVVPQRGEGQRDSEVHRHILCPDIYNQQCKDRVLERKASAKNRQRRYKHLWNLLQKPPWFFPLLLSWLQSNTLFSVFINLKVLIFRLLKLLIYKPITMWSSHINSEHEWLIVNILCFRLEYNDHIDLLLGDSAWRDEERKWKSKLLFEREARERVWSWLGIWWSDHTD